MREMMEAGDQDEDMTPAEIEAQKKNPMYHKMLKKLKQLQKLRHIVIKSYFEKHKYKKNHRNEIIQAAEETEESLQEYLREDYVRFMDAYPEIREFMEQVNRDQEKKIADIIERKGQKQGDLPDIARLRLEAD